MSEKINCPFCGNLIDVNVIKCDNGTEGILFTDTVDVEPYEYVKNIDRDYLDEYLLSLANYSDTPYFHAEDAKQMVSIYLHSLFMPDLLQTKPIISTVGTKGSGKTTLLRIMLKCLYGKYADVTAMTNKMEDLDTIIAKRHFIVIDNLDTFSDGVNDKIASYATGVINEKRRLYSDGEVYKERVEAFIGISTRNPVFRRDDVAQRVIIINLDPLTKYSTERQIIEPVLRYRNEILSQIIALSLCPIHKNKILTISILNQQALLKILCGQYKQAKGLLKQSEKIGKQRHFISGLAFSAELSAHILFADNKKADAAKEARKAAKLYKQLDGRAEVDRSDTLLRNEFRARYDNSISLGKRLSNIKSDISDFIKIETGKNRGNVTVYRISEGKHFDDLKNGLQV